MSEDPCNIGIMHPAFQVPKTVLLKWINEFFELNYTKVEQCASGAVHCQILDSIYPGKVPMSKVNWEAKSDYEYTNNFKIVQQVFTKQNIAKPIAIEKLTKAKFQDNLEFLQWMKHYFDCKYGGQPYSASERRAKGKGANKLKGLGPPAASTKTSTTKASTSTKTTTATKPKSTTNKAKTTEKKSSAAAAAAAASTEEADNLKEQMSTLQATCEGLEKERNFYFGKLREIEILCQQEEQEVDAPALKEAVLAILYATDEGDEAAEGDAAEGGAEAEAEAEAEDETF